MGRMGCMTAKRPECDSGWIIIKTMETESTYRGFEEDIWEDYPEATVPKEIYRFLPPSKHPGYLSEEEAVLEIGSIRQRLVFDGPQRLSKV